MLPIELTVGNLPLNFSGSYAEFYAALRDRLRGVVPDSKVLTGFVGSANPRINFGLWLKTVGSNAELWIWENGSYRPVKLRIEGAESTGVTLIASPSAARTQTLQNKSGTVALLYDIYVPIPTKILSGAAPVLNWPVAKHFIHRLTANTVYSFSGATNGDKIMLTAQNNATTFTAAFPAVVKWPGGTAPVQPVGSAGKNAVGLYELWYIQGVYYGKFKGASTATPDIGVDIDPGETAPSSYGQSQEGHGPVTPYPRHFL